MEEFLMFLGTVCLVLAILFIGLIVLTVYSCCVVSSRCSKQEDIESEELQNKSVILSDMERQTVCELKEELLKDINK